MGRPVPSKLRRLHRCEDGIALGVVIVGVLAIALLTFLVQRLAVSQTTQSDFFANEDAVLAGAEAILDRYASKLSIDPLYYQVYVDEAEAPRRCSDPGSPSFDAVVTPGNAWIPDCSSWTYEFTETYFYHPLLTGDAAGFDDVGVLMHVVPPLGAERLEVEIVGRQAERATQRVISAEIGPVPTSEFLWLVEGDLLFGDEAKTFGKVYAGGLVGYEAGGEAHADVYAEDVIADNYKLKNKRYDAPIWMNGAQGWDSTGNHNASGEVITEVYPDPVDFDVFWSDLDSIAWAACYGGGLCLDSDLNPAVPAGAQAYLLETVASGSQIQVSYATAAPKDNSCNTSTKEARWTVASQKANWIPLGTFDIPRNGALWADEIVVIGRNSTNPFVLDGALTIYTGDSSDRNNIIIGSDVSYAGGPNGDDVLGLIASDEVFINPNAVGADGVLNIYGSILSQNGDLQVAMSCLNNGVCRTDPGVRVNVYGSIAALTSGNLGTCFADTYDFDARLEGFRPPLFPLLSDEWSLSNWRETPQSCWVDNTCP